MVIWLKWQYIWSVGLVSIIQDMHLLAKYLEEGNDEVGSIPELEREVLAWFIKCAMVAWFTECVGDCGFRIAMGC